MLELRTYTKSEMAAMFGTSGRQALKRKLQRCGVEFTITGRGENTMFTIIRIANPFKIFCITELGFNDRYDFYKLLYFFYYFFNDEEFRAMPDEAKEILMGMSGHPISRQTITGYTRKLDAANLIDRNTSNYHYYFAHLHEYRVVEKEEYNIAWHNYWNDIKNGYNSFDAIYRMIAKHGGVARKQPIPEFNGIYNDKIKLFHDLIEDEIQKEIELELKSLN